MLDDRYSDYIAQAREMRRQYLASLAREAWAGLTTLVRRSIARLTAPNDPLGKIRNRPT